MPASISVLLLVGRVSGKYKQAQSDRLWASLEVSCGRRCQTEGGTAADAARFPKKRHIVVEWLELSVGWHCD